MDVRVVTLRYQEGIQGFAEEALTRATAGREVLEVRDHFFMHGSVPHLALVLLLGDAQKVTRRRQGPDPGDELPEERKVLYRELRTWRNERARADGVPMVLAAPYQFRADHPFIFLIRDRETEAVLFLGRALNPVK